MSFFKKFFGIKSSGTTGAREESGSGSDAQEVHEGFTIAAAPQKEGGQYRLAGTISKDIGGEMKTHHLIRADLFSDKDEAVQFTIRKAKQVIKEQGERMFG